MASAKETLTTIENELAAIRSEIDRLKIEEATLVRLLGSLNGQEVASPRRRTPNVKPLVLDIMQHFGPAGGTSQAVYTIVKSKHPGVSRDSVSSVLSRLKSAGALFYDGEKYFDARFARGRVNDIIGIAAQHLNAVA